MFIVMKEHVSHCNSSLALWALNTQTILVSWISSRLVLFFTWDLLIIRKHRVSQVSTYSGSKRSQTSGGWQGTGWRSFPAVGILCRSSSHRWYPTCSCGLLLGESGMSPPHWSDVECDTSEGLFLKSNQTQNHLMSDVVYVE